MAVYQNLTLTQVSQNIDENSSKIGILWQSTQTGASYNAIADVGRYSIYVNDQLLCTEEVTYWLPQNTTQTIAQVEKTILHNGKGEAEVTVLTWMNTHISAGIVELRQTLKLDPIPQASIVTATDGVIGGVSRLAVTRKNAACTHAIGWQFGGLTGYLTAEGEICEEAVRFSGESLDFSIPESFYGEIPTEKSGICTLTIYTYSGNDPVGTAQTAQFTVSVPESACIPTVIPAVVDGNPVTLALTGDEKTLVRYCSEAFCRVSAEGKNGAWITEKRLQGKTLEESCTIANVETGEFLAEATDSRGFTGKTALQVELVPYIRLTCLASACREGAASGEATLSISGDFYDGSFGAAENQLTLAYSIDGENFIPVTAETADGQYAARVQLTEMDYTRLYTITVRAGDCLSQLEKKVTLKKGVPTFDWGEEDFAFHVPVQADGGLNVDGSLTLGGRPLLDVFYPVGTVYTAAAGNAPAALFGGTWEQLQGNEDSVFRWKRTG